MWFAVFCYAQHDTVIIRPQPIDDILQNPNMGITTFNRFNGQALNPALEWSEVGPTEKVAQAATSKYRDCPVRIASASR